ncbi:MAG: J domain-containing protein [Prosthecobacter sp.]
MKDCFELLGLPRRALLDENELQAAWHQKSRAVHPDQSGGSATMAAEINTAYETLLAPEKRLKHLLELHAVPWRTIPISTEIMALFSQIGPQLQNAVVLTKKKQTASSVIAKALLAPEELKLREVLEDLVAQIEARRAELLASLADASLDQVQVVQATLAYLAKWQGQLRESLLVLM